jgi:hypothetical protein
MLDNLTDDVDMQKELAKFGPQFLRDRQKQHCMNLCVGLHMVQRMETFFATSYLEKNP